MPFRFGAYVEHCVQCTVPAGGGCFRCGQPLCRQHRPDGDHRCDDCEAEFASLQPIVAWRPAPRVMGLGFRVALLLGTTAVIAVLPFAVSAGTFFTLLMAVPAAVLFTLEVSLRRDAQALRQKEETRRRFLLEQKAYRRANSLTAQI